MIKRLLLLTKELEASGIAIHYEENIDQIPKDPKLGSVYTGCTERSQGVSLLPASMVLKW